MDNRTVNPIAAAGINFSGECRFLFWTGWLALTAAVLGLLFGEYALRSEDSWCGYFFEALVFMLGWLGALYFADHTAIRLYRLTWRQLKTQVLAPVTLDHQVIEQIRAELAGDPLLRWIKPPKSRDIGGQLMTVALWWQAVTAPDGAPRWQRYGEWIIDTVLGFFPLVAAVFVLIAWPGWKGFGTASLLGGIGLAVLGYSSVRFAARRQAIVDYFAAWLGGE